MAVAHKMNDDGFILIKFQISDLRSLNSLRPFLVSNDINFEIQQFSLVDEGLLFRDDGYSLLRVIKLSQKSPRLVFLNISNEIAFDQVISIDGSVFHKELDFAGINKFQN